ncbi:hypothetical protein CEUSTIGMA_g971.t1 [Chlamydomonas eustigma]|uniref:Uncharacterized protein n=1 Tax=Chlamydomonas eustigma TaxID=1157962 RepID=A0A250WS62_9CHLO|nr:hypothetical protein CEUSTIGMA_g971.t1 [Chlamydomonas eustigma]|eukprot:GAX73519.1 hypothetical protein CEUSTIGMA_g971.t1 [Chlamydomonas eustigma]
MSLLKLSSCRCGRRAFFTKKHLRHFRLCCNALLKLDEYVDPYVSNNVRKVLTTIDNPFHRSGEFSHFIIQSAPHGASYVFITFCALSVAVGALVFNLISNLSLLSQLVMHKEENQERLVLYGVDVTNSVSFKHPEVLRAVEFAAEAHLGQFRKTGEPYVSHCIEAALIVENMLPPLHQKKHISVIVAAVLHDVIDDTEVPLLAISDAFGEEVSNMVSSVSKLSQMNQLMRRGKRQGWAEYSPEDFRAVRKMIMVLAFEKPLVILIKLADRLHNMRSVHILRPEKQVSVAEETLEIWCTLAECLGWDAIKSELEDLCFAVNQPDDYSKLRAELDRLWNLPTVKIIDDGQQQQQPLLLSKGSTSSYPSRELDNALKESMAAAAAAAASTTQSPTDEAARFWSQAAASSSRLGQGLLPLRAAAVTRAMERALKRGSAVETAGAAIGTTSNTFAAGSTFSVGQKQILKDSPSSDQEIGVRLVTRTSAASGVVATDSDDCLRALDGVSEVLLDGDIMYDGDCTPAITSSHSNTSVSQQPILPSYRSSDRSKQAELKGAVVTPSTPSSRPCTASSSEFSASASYVSASSSPTGRGAAKSSAAVTAGPAPATSSSWVIEAQRDSAKARGEVGGVITLVPAAAAPSPLPVVGNTPIMSLAPTTTEASPSDNSVTGYSGPAGRSPAEINSSSGRSSIVLPAFSDPVVQRQVQLEALLSTVVPFDSVNFKSSKALSASTRRGLEVLDDCAGVLQREVQLRGTSAGLAVVMEGRLKSLQSVYRKMARKRCSVQQVYDARALRVIVDDDGGARVSDAVEVCYQIVSTVHSIWKSIPKEFDDYIANPKPSGYQALHTAVKGPGGIPMEVQIKTRSMHDLAEYGAAAHWVYKEYVPVVPRPQEQPRKEHRQHPAGEGACDEDSQRLVIGSSSIVVPAVRGINGYVGQPVLRIAKDKLRYGTVVEREPDGSKLTVAIKLGGTFAGYPTRVSQYSFYWSLLQYVKEKGWRVPGLSDYNLRLEEYVMSKDGRYHRLDHMGYRNSAETITLLEGFEEEAEGALYLEAAAAGHASAATSVPPLTTSTDVVTTHSRVPEPHMSSSTNVNGGNDMLGPEERVTVEAVSPSGDVAPSQWKMGSPATGTAALLDAQQARSARLMQEAFLRTQYLRAMIEWGEQSLGPRNLKPPRLPASASVSSSSSMLDPAAAILPGSSEEVSVLIWPDCKIEYFPRGTTVGKVFRERVNVSFHPDMPLVAFGDLMVNVNNRLVPEETLLNDGDLVILARDKVKI